MTVYLDNDAACKLAGYGLFDAFLKAYGVSPLRVFRRSTMIDYFGLRGAVPSAKLKDVAHQTSLFDLMKKTHPPSVNSGALKLQARLVGFPKIDEGEAQLIAYACADPRSYFVTGDKKALRALAVPPALADVVATMAGRCVHIEQVIRAIAGSIGMPATRAAVLAREPGIDIAIHEALANPLKVSDAAADANLVKLVESLRAQTSTLLAP